MTWRSPGRRHDSPGSPQRSRGDDRRDTRRCGQLGAAAGLGVAILSLAAPGVTMIGPDPLVGDRARAVERARVAERDPRRCEPRVRLTGAILAGSLSLALVPIGGAAFEWLAAVGFIGAPIGAVLGALLVPHVLRGDRTQAALVAATFGLAASAFGAVVVAVGVSFGPAAHGFGDDDLQALMFFGVYGLVLSPVASIITIPLACIWAAVMRTRFRGGVP